MKKQPEASMSAEAHAVYDELLDAGITVPTQTNYQQYRADLIAASKTEIEQLVNVFDGDICELEIAGVRCKQITPGNWSQANGRCIQYAYGGGYVSGSTFEDQVITIPLAQQANARVVMVDYRLSPEHPYPAPQQDMQRVYPQLVSQYGAPRLVLGGESAGGHQAVGLMQFVRDQGYALPACAALFSPWTDLRNQGDSHIFNDGRDPTLNNDWVESAAEMHAAGTALDHPGVSPLCADMHDLPPCIITSGSRDLLLSQCLSLAQKLRSANVECDLRVWEGMWHVFEFYPIPEAAVSISEVAAFIKSHS